MTIKNTSFTVYSILYNSGKIELLTLTPAQLAGMNRRKGFKKSVVSIKKHVSITITVKHLQ